MNAQRIEQRLEQLLEQRRSMTETQQQELDRLVAVFDDTDELVDDDLQSFGDLCTDCL